MVVGPGDFGGPLRSRLHSGLHTSRCVCCRTQLDTFVIKGTDIGDVQRIVIWHDDSGLGSDWHLQQVDVFNPSTQVRLEQLGGGVGGQGRHLVSIT